MAQGEQKILLSISIPAGVSAGQTLGVKVPDGRELTVVVPSGAGANRQGQIVYQIHTVWLVVWNIFYFSMYWK